MLPDEGLFEVGEIGAGAVATAAKAAVSGADPIAIVVVKEVEAVEAIGGVEVIALAAFPFPFPELRGIGLLFEEDDFVHHAPGQLVEFVLFVARSAKDKEKQEQNGNDFCIHDRRV